MIYVYKTGFYGSKTATAARSPSVQTEIGRNT